MKNVKFSSLRTGDIVSCVIGSHKISRAIVEKPVAKHNKLWLCQDKADGDGAENKHGMKYSWVVDYSENAIECDEVSDVVIINRKGRKVKDGTVTITYERDGIEYSRGFIGTTEVEYIRDSVATLRKELNEKIAMLECYTRCAKRGWVVASRSKAKK